MPAGPHLVTMCGAKGGVGTTTLAVNLAIALAQAGRRTVLVDADLSSPDACALCDLDGCFHLADVLAGRCSAHEAIEPGPGGIGVLPGAWAARDAVDGSGLACPGPDPVNRSGLACPGPHTATLSSSAWERLLFELKRLGRQADFVLLDAGSGTSLAVRRCWQSADTVLLVTTPDAVSVFDAYTALKLAPAVQSGPNNPAVRRVWLAVNQADEAQVAQEVQARLARACFRFLGWQPHAAGYVPADPAVSAASRCRRPLVLAWPQAPAARGAVHLAERLLEAVPTRFDWRAAWLPWRKSGLEQARRSGSGSLGQARPLVAESL